MKAGLVEARELRFNRRADATRSARRRILLGTVGEAHCAELQRHRSTEQTAQSPYITTWFGGIDRPGPVGRGYANLEYKGVLN
jgi:hypothetical protein